MIAGGGFASLSQRIYLFIEVLAHLFHYYNPAIDIDADNAEKPRGV